MSVFKKYFKHMFLQKKKSTKKNMNISTTEQITHLSMKRQKL